MFFFRDMVLSLEMIRRFIQTGGFSVVFVFCFAPYLFINSPPSFWFSPLFPPRFFSGLHSWLVRRFFFDCRGPYMVPFFLLTWFTPMVSSLPQDLVLSCLHLSFLRSSRTYTWTLLGFTYPSLLESIFQNSPPVP